MMRHTRPLPPTSIAQALTKASLVLRGLHTGAPELEARVLLARVLDRPQSHLYAWPERPLEPTTLTAYTELVNRRASGEPLAYITGHREFWSLDLHIRPTTLIPRPATERLVEQTLEHIPEHAGPAIADLGTGSGAVALAIAGERAACRITATDISWEVLEVTRQNIDRLALSNIEVARGSWCEALRGDTRFDFIVSNPPYIASADPHLLQGDLVWEPKSALESGADGLDAIRTIATQAPHHLHPNGWLVLEHGYDQGVAVRDILAHAGFAGIQTHRDLAGLERVTEGRRN